MKAFIPGKLILTEYLMYYFKTIESDVLAGVRGVTADNIDFKAFQQRLIVVPPMELQNAFTIFVSQVDKSKFVDHEPGLSMCFLQGYGQQQTRLSLDGLDCSRSSDKV